MYQFILRTYQRFLNFLKRPDDRSFSRVNLSFKIRTLLSLLLLNVILVFVWMLLLPLFGEEGLENVNSEMMKLPYGTLILVGVVIIPFVEELIFRLPMKYSRNYLLQFLISLVALFAPAESKTTIYSNVRSFWKRHFWIFFYILSSVFAFMHIFNYVDFKHLLLWSPVLTMVQFITGLIIGYIRVRFGFLWGWYYHAFYNLLFFSLAFTSGEQPMGQKPSPFHGEDCIHTDTITGGLNFDSCRVDNPEFLFRIARSNDKKSSFAGYYGVTPTRIYFEQCTLQFMMSILSPKGMIIVDEEKKTYDVELIMKEPTNNVNKAKEILLCEITKAFSMK